MKNTRIAASVQGMVQYKPLLKELVSRDLKVKYRRSFLGYVWSLLNPLMMMAVMTVVFSYMFRFDIPNYPLYLICGQTLWTFFNESTNMAMYSVLQNGYAVHHSEWRADQKGIYPEIYFSDLPCCVQFCDYEL